MLNTSAKQGLYIWSEVKKNMHVFQMLSIYSYYCRVQSLQAFLKRQYPHSVILQASESSAEIQMSKLQLAPFGTSSLLFITTCNRDIPIFLDYSPDSVHI